MQRNDSNLTAIVKPIYQINLNNELMTIVSMPQQEDSLINDRSKNYKTNEAPFLLQNTFKINGLEEFKIDSYTNQIMTKNSLNHDLKSFCIINEKEEFMIPNKDDFIKKLGVKSDTKIKVVSIFGNTGDGKSHTLNNIFFDGNEIFKTSTEQTPCTFGIYCQLDLNKNCLVFDTEGLQGGSQNMLQRFRLLLKLFSISDIIIYRTMAPRLHADMYKFLSDASRVYKKYLYPELCRLAEKLDVGPGFISDVGPSLIIFHETFTTNPLPLGKSGKDINKYFHDLKLDVSAFADLHYVGTKTNSYHSNKPKKQENIVSNDIEYHDIYYDDDDNIKLNDLNCKDEYSKKLNFDICTNRDISSNHFLNINGNDCTTNRQIIYRNNENKDNVETDFSLLMLKIEETLKNCRPARRLTAIFSLFKILNNRFNDDIAQNSASKFPDDFFLCEYTCIICNKRCKHAINHAKIDRNYHEAEANNLCTFHKKFQNITYRCRTCCEKKRESVVSVKNSSDNSWLTTTWTGYILDCSCCGVIYKSREYWYGNPDPEKSAVYTMLHHVWGDEDKQMDKQNTARKFLDGINYVSDVISSTSAAPTKMVSDWIVDKIAPTYWESNSEITHCRSCERQFTDILKIHHCRSCGRGFCAECSDFRRAVPERNWGMQLVRVCKNCYNCPPPKITDVNMDGSDLVARKIGEALGDTASVFANIVNYPLEALKDAARPTYWVPDSDIIKCACCERNLDDLNPLTTKHHCRACGQGVCDTCSRTRKPVQSRGWENPVRVCDNCIRGN